MSVTNSQDLRFDELPGRSSADPLRDRETVSSMRIVRLDVVSTRRAHRHPLSEEVVYVSSGHGTAFVDGTPHRIGPGDVLHVPAGAPHATIPDAGQLVELVCFFPHPRLSENLQETDIQVTAEEQ